MSTKEHLQYWQWQREVEGGYIEFFLLFLYDDAVSLKAHIDYHGSREPRQWSIEAARRAERGAFEGIPDDVWDDLRARLG